MVNFQIDLAKHFTTIIQGSGMSLALAVVWSASVKTYQVLGYEEQGVKFLVPVENRRCLLLSDGLFAREILSGFSIRSKFAEIIVHSCAM